MSGKQLLVIWNAFFHLEWTWQTILTDEDERHEKGKVLPEDRINSIINYMDTEFTGNASKWLLPLTILAVR